MEKFKTENPSEMPSDDMIRQWDEIGQEWNELYGKFIQETRNFITKHGGRSRINVKCMIPFPEEVEKVSNDTTQDFERLCLHIND